jgi:site-specific DNA-cytosine methylase
VLFRSEHHGHTYQQVGEWMAQNGYEKEVEKCKRMFTKLEKGGNIMRRGTIIPKDHLGAFVGHYPTMLTHPYEDRYITYREALSIMGMPEDYELLDPSNSYNHICQNVPVRTAADMATEVKAVLDGQRDYVDSDLVFQYNSDRTTDIKNNKHTYLMEYIS